MVPSGLMKVKVSAAGVLPGLMKVSPLNASRLTSSVLNAKFARLTASDGIMTRLFAPELPKAVVATRGCESTTATEPIEKEPSANPNILAALDLVAAPAPNVIDAGLLDPETIVPSWDRAVSVIDCEVADVLMTCSNEKKPPPWTKRGKVVVLVRDVSDTPGETPRSARDVTPEPTLR